MITVMLVAIIVAGEVGTTVPDARMAVACTVVEDARRGRDIQSRWYGRGDPTPADVRAARRALDGDCSNLPYLRFLGNAKDLETWSSRGWVDESDELMWWRNGEYAAVGVVSEAVDRVSSDNKSAVEGVSIEDSVKGPGRQLRLREMIR